MATRKKKQEVIISAEIAESMEMPGTIGSAKLVFPAEPTVVKGSHLTITYNNGYPVKLEWDDAALLRDVQEAIATYVPTEEVTPKKTRKKKVAE